MSRATVTAGPQLGSTEGECVLHDRWRYALFRPVSAGPFDRLCHRIQFNFIRTASYDNIIVLSGQRKGLGRGMSENRQVGV